MTLPPALPHDVTSPSAPLAGAAETRGWFIAFEGGDGAGKTTQIGLLADWLRDRGRHVRVTREPGGTELGGRLRELLLHGDHVGPRAEALLFAADRAHHVDSLIAPALAAGETVVADRFMDSSIAYQGAGRDLDAAHVRDLSLWATGSLVPDLTVVLDVSPQVGRARRGSGHDRLEAEPDGFHARVRAVFLDLAAAQPTRYLVLDATQAPETIAAAVRARVEMLEAGRP